jgi:hybrid cluster-associated redox disulfide protein
VEIGRISPRITVSEALLTYPGTRKFILKHEMACIGCYMSVFCSLIDAARYYGQELEAFLNEIEAASQSEKPISKEKK